MIVIIGAGISGLTLAYALIERGEKVRVVDAGAVASGASGIATAYLEPRPGSLPIREFEHHAHRMWPDLIARIEQNSGQTVSFNRTGQIRVTLPGNVDHFDQDFAERNSPRWPGQILSQDELTNLEPALSAHINKAAKFANLAWMDAAAVCDALAAAIRKFGGGITEHWNVTQIEDNGGEYVLTSDTGDTITASKIVLCNAMGRNQLQGVAGDIPQCQPIRGVVLVVDQSDLPHPITHMIKHKFGHLCPQSGNRLIIGTTYEKTVSDLTVSPATIELLYDRAEAIVPQIRELPLLEVNSGIRARSPSGLLLIGRSQLALRQYFSLGHGGSGYLRAPVVMEAMAEFILTGEKTGPAGYLISG